MLSYRLQHMWCREAFLPGSKAGVHSSQTEAAYGPDSVGKYDPILHQWIIQPDHQKWQAREREHANQVTQAAAPRCIFTRQYLHLAAL